MTMFYNDCVKFQDHDFDQLLHKPVGHVSSCRFAWSNDLHHLSISKSRSSQRASHIQHKN